jgi:hypothetical protein
MAKGDVMKDKWLVGVVVMALSIAVACMGETDPLTGGAPTTGEIVAGEKNNPGGSTGHRHYCAPDGDLAGNDALKQ